MEVAQPLVFTAAALRMVHAVHGGCRHQHGCEPVAAAPVRSFMKLRAYLVSALASGALLGAPCVPAAQGDEPLYVSPWRTPWDYSEGPRGPAHWGALDPGYSLCNAGHAQSPVDI